VLAGSEAQLDHLFGRVLLDQLAWRSLSGEPALVHDDEPVAELLGFVHVVRRDHQRHPVLLQAIEPVPEQVAGLRVEPGRRLVEDEQVRVRDQGTRDGETSLHAAREGIDPIVGPLGQLGEVEQLLRPLADHLLGHIEVAPVDHQVVEHRELQVQRVLLWHQPHPGSNAGTVLRRVHPEHTQRALAERADAGDHSHGRRLAGPVRSEKTEGLALGDGEIDPVHGNEITEALDEPTRLHHG
jgi:hypothetical protein